MSEQGVIKKLDEDVINRIAAGEIIQRPANALKELIENSLDAKSTNIQITVKQGGLKLLQIQDNGTGIRKDDFTIVCERFTTSKLRKFEDLHRISTYGFRGEALASISHIAHLSIISKTKTDICAYQSEFVDGKLKAPPKPIAGNQGTIITVEDLFYNMNVRRKALRSPAEEYQKISEVVSRYAVHNASVGFALRKSGENNDVRTPQNSNQVENIRIIYGNSIARELIQFEMKNEPLKFKAYGHMTNVNYSTKKFQLLLFINHRLVDCHSLKKCIDNVYQTYLPKNMHPFVYLSLELDPNNVDINVHPTKHEVHFLNEEQIVEQIMTALEAKLLGSNNSRVFYTQAKLPGLQFETKESLKDRDKIKYVYDKDMVRTDANDQKLEKFFGPAIKITNNERAIAIDKNKEKPENSVKDKEKNLNVSLTEAEYEQQHKDFLERQADFENDCLDKTADKSLDIIKSPEIPKAITETLDPVDIEMFEETPKEPCQSTNITAAVPKPNGNGSPQEASKLVEVPLSKHLIKKITKVQTKLTSILQLRKEVEESCHRSLRETFAQHVFVGPINPTQALIQYGTKLLLCNTKKILEELFYQMILYNFENFDYYKLKNPLPIRELALIGLDQEETGWTEEDGPKEELAQRICEILTEKGPMLHAYFSMEIDVYGRLQSIPILLENYIPDPISYPLYLIRLATEVEWKTEKECFDTFSRETARFYSNVSKDVYDGKDWQWITEHILYPAIKEYFIPPKNFAENAAVLEIADLPNLYKVFERC